MDTRSRCHRFTAASILLLLLPPAIASTTADAPALDLDLPRAPMFTGAGTSGAPGMPGPDYDRVLRERELARGGGEGRASNCPPAADGSDRGITGNISTGIGHSSRGGNSHWSAADINMCREYDGNAGSPGTLNMRIRVGQYDGPGYIHGPGSGHGYHGPGARGFHGPGDPWDMGPDRDRSWSGARQPWR